MKQPFLLLIALASLLPGRAGAQTSPWAVTAQATTGLSSVTAVATDVAGNSVVAGTFQGTLTLGSTTLTCQGAQDVFVARLNPAGQWTMAAGTGSTGLDHGVAVAADGAGNLVVAGTFGGPQLTAGATTLVNAGSANTEDVFVARCSANGQWTQAVRGGTDRELVNSLVVDANGTAYVAGNFFSSVAPFGTASLANANATSTTSDVFVAQLSPAGQWTRALRDGGPNSEAPVLAARLTGSDLLLVGTFYDNTTLGGRPLALAGWGGPLPFATRLGGFALAARSAAAGPLQVWPNPAQTRVTVGLPAGETTLLVFDACGREVRHTETAAGRSPTLELSLEGLPAGIYVLRCGAGTARLQVM